MKMTTDVLIVMALAWLNGFAIHGLIASFRRGSQSKEVTSGVGEVTRSNAVDEKSQKGWYVEN